MTLRVLLSPLDQSRPWVKAAGKFSIDTHTANLLSKVRSVRVQRVLLEVHLPVKDMALTEGVQVRDQVVLADVP